MLTPSSNTVLEPVSAAMLSGTPDITAHFSRFKVTEIALSDRANSQFHVDEILRAAELLAHAKVDTIAWNGTSGSWLGFDEDEALCERIKAATGIAATTSSLALREIFQRTKARRIGLVTPYLDDVQAKIMSNYAASGFACSAERHLRLQDNYSFATVSEDTIAGLVRVVATEGCDAIAIVCTNMRGAGIADRLERELGVPVYDSIAVTIWISLLLASEDPRQLSTWGQMFRDDRLSEPHSASLAPA
jgi:maleate isomerase